jgi:hypothetical protein
MREIVAGRFRRALLKRVIALDAERDASFSVVERLVSIYTRT